MKNSTKQKKWQKVFDTCIVIGILCVSLLLYVNRERIAGLEQYGYAGTFLLCFLSNATVLLPAPSLAVVVSMAQYLNPVLVALIGALGSSLGELTGYVFGRSSGGMSKTVVSIGDKIANHIHNINLLVFVLALIPLPLFDVAGIYAGIQKMPPWRFLFWCYIGKALKMIAFVLFASKILDIIM